MENKIYDCPGCDRQFNPEKELLWKHIGTSKCCNICSEEIIREESRL